ncbi:hypothetical protein [Bacillus methanolicus]|uniref:hypothetical protein n=1 Tax=Bacillus methanolicus TaxID=1471 RepID=UPI00238088FD|nr:hypothetical protein [Bacillus methanolicus]
MRERTGSIHVRGKGNKEQTVPTPKELRRKLMEYLSERTDSNPALFVSNRGAAHQRPEHPGHLEPTE